MAENLRRRLVRLFMGNRMMRYMFLLWICMILILTGCGGKEKPAYYEIPKSEITENTPHPKTSAKPSASPSPITETPEPAVTSANTEDGPNDADGEYPEPMNLLNWYAHGLIDAINAGDFSLVEEYLLEGSNLYYMQKKLVYDLYAVGTMESLDSIEKIDEKWENPDKCFVSTREVATIYYKSGDEETNTYYWTYTMVRKGGKYYLTDIVKYEK